MSMVHIGYFKDILENLKKPDWPLPWDSKKYRDAQYGLSDMVARKGRSEDQVKKQPLLPIPKNLSRYMGSSHD